MSTQAWHYLSGLLHLGKGQANMERMEEQIESLPYHQYQHFLSNSPWSSSVLLDQVGTDASSVMAAEQSKNGHPTGLLIDESGHLKKGTASVGVARQYAGIIGKVDNCQVGVYASLSNGKRCCLLDERLFLPASWIIDEDRLDTAGVPQAARIYKTKAQLALDLVDNALQREVKFDWVGGDGLYGHSYELAKGLDQRDLLFVLDIHKDQHVYLDEPALYLPEREGNRGRKPKCYKIKNAATSIRVDAYAKTLSPTDDFEKISIRPTTKGTLKAWIHTQLVWVWDGKEQKARQRILLIRKTIGKDGKITDTKYALSNAKPEQYTKQQLAFMQAQRYWVERCFDDGKNELGMSDYQIRKWNAWHHHHAIVILAMLLLLKEQIDQETEFPMMSLADARKMVVALIIQAAIPPAIATQRERNNMEKRHRKRKKAAQWYLRKQKF